jgi:hypothetical protein
VTNEECGIDPALLMTSAQTLDFRSGVGFIAAVTDPHTGQRRVAIQVGLTIGAVAYLDWSDVLDLVNAVETAKSVHHTIDRKPW